VNSEVECERWWQHQRELDIGEESADPAARHDLGVRTGLTWSVARGEVGACRDRQLPCRATGDLGKRLPTRRSVTAFAPGRPRTVGASAASAGVVPLGSDTAGHGLRVRDDERGGFGPLRQRCRGGYVRENRSFL